MARTRTRSATERTAASVAAGVGQHARNTARAVERRVSTAQAEGAQNVAHATRTAHQTRIQKLKEAGARARQVYEAESQAVAAARSEAAAVASKSRAAASGAMRDSLASAGKAVRAAKGQVSRVVNSGLKSTENGLQFKSGSFPRAWAKLQAARQSSDAARNAPAVRRAAFEGIRQAYRRRVNPVVAAANQNIEAAYAAQALAREETRTAARTAIRTA